MAPTVLFRVSVASVPRLTRLISRRSTAALSQLTPISSPSWTSHRALSFTAPTCSRSATATHSNSIEDGYSDPFVHEEVAPSTKRTPTGPEKEPGAALPSLLPLALRPYQLEAIEACLKGLSRGLTRIGVSAPTGSGKTTMFMSLVPRVQHEGRGQVLVLVGSVELALQAEAAAKRILGPEYTVEVEQSKRVAGGKADVTIATYQTLNNPERLMKFDPSDFKLVIVDEAHHAAALSYLRLLHYFNDAVQLPLVTGPFSTFDHGNKVPIIGFSATFTRHDQLALNAAFEEIVYHREVGHMLEEGWLAPVQYTKVYAELHLDEVDLTQKGDFSARSLASHVNTPAINQLIVRTWLHQATERRSTLVFAVNLKHVADLVHEFRAAGVDARSVSAHTDLKERKETIAAFGAGEFPVLINCQVLTEGTDIPQVDCIVLARPTKSKNLLAQMVGRGLRLSPDTGKNDCLLLDIVDSVAQAGGMQVSPTLLGLSYEDGAEDERPKRDRGNDSPPVHTTEPQKAHVRRVQFVNCGDPFALGRGAEVQSLEEMTRFAWVFCGNNRYILELMNIGFVTILKDEAWTVYFTQKLPVLDRNNPPSSPYKQRIPVAQAETLERALQSADKFVEKRLGDAGMNVLHRAAFWRSKRASEKQIKMLLSMLNVTPEEAAEKGVSIGGTVMPLNRVTAGQVNAFTVAKRHGAVGIKKKQDKANVRATEKRTRRQKKAAEHASRNLPLPGIDI